MLSFHFCIFIKLIAQVSLRNFILKPFHIFQKAIDWAALAFLRISEFVAHMIAIVLDNCRKECFPGIEYDGIILSRLTVALHQLAAQL